jgi:hypothetical protein
MGRRSSEVIELENQRVLAFISQGDADVDACRKARVGHGAWRRRLDRDAALKATVLRLRGNYEAPAPKESVPGFITFRRESIGFETPKHQHEWYEAIDSSDTTLILEPPEHGKTTFCEDYCTWRVVSDRNIRILYISKTQVAARKRLLRIKKLLSDETFFRRHGLKSIPETWGPFRPLPYEKDLSWAAEAVYVSGTDAANRDPTVEALGVGNQIQGSRADIIVLDDIATLDNQLSPVEMEKMWTWLGQEVVSRLPPDGGKLIFIGTRVDPYDIYSRLLEIDELENPETGEKRPLTKLVQPAILDEEDKTTLWPERWPYEALIRRREHPMMNKRSWALTYQQQATGLGDATFAPESIEAAKDRGRAVGQAPPGCVVAMGVDPASVGHMGVCITALDRKTNKRYLVDVDHPKGLMHLGNIRPVLVDLAKRYGAVACRVEKNNISHILIEDPQFVQELAEVGCRVESWHTSENKYDPNWGLPAVAGQWAAGLYSVPWADQHHKIRSFLEELGSWRPETKGERQNRVIAMWLAEISLRKMPTGEPVEQVEQPRWLRGLTGVPEFARALKR